MPLGDKKYCGGCGKNKLVNLFSRSSRTTDGLCEQCKVCCAKRGKEWREKHPERYKETHKKWLEARPEYSKNRNYVRNYGITLEEATALFNEQDGKCGICGFQLVLGGRQENGAHLDHNHETGKIRGFLCFRCNHGLGNFRDNKELLNNAIEYVTTH